MTGSAPGAAVEHRAVAAGEPCPSCLGGKARIIYTVDDVPTNQVRLMRTREEAVGCSRGDLRLAFCESCGFIWNTAFDLGKVDYRGDYESTQAASATFNRYHEELARALFERHALAGKRIFEIGCGQGEFVDLLAGLGAGQVVGFDPAVREPRTGERVTLVKDFYSERYADWSPDLVVTKMTMEHIPDPARFLSMIRRTVGDRPDVTVHAMMPDMGRILEQRCFWDVYYEHCAYFTLGALARGFRRAGFEVLDLHREFGDQYAVIEARPGTGSTVLPAEEEVAALARMVDDFVADVARRRAAWQGWLGRETAAGRRTVLWGGGSKAVSFLTTLGVADEVDFAVDINPRRQGTFLPASGHPIEAPRRLADAPPDNVVVMSPIYMDEIRADLSAMGLTPTIHAIEGPPPSP